MSLTVARSIAFSALSAAQTRIAVTTANTANADTEGYTRKLAKTTADVQGAAGAGVSVASIVSTTDKLLVRSLAVATGKTAAAEVTSDFADRIAALMGEVSTSEDGTGTSLADAVASLEAALADLAATPESETLETAVVTALDDLTTQMRETSSALADLDALNDAIVEATVRGEPTGDLEDQRNTALIELSSHLDVTAVTGTDGRMRVYTASGKTLVSDRVHELAFTAAASTSVGTTLSGISVDGTDVTASIKSGDIAAALAVRDETIPAVQAELDELASALASALNDVHNGGTAYPAPANLTGSVATDAADAFSATGTLRVAVLEADGTVVSSLDLDLSTYATVGDLVAAIDAVDGLSATIDADGHLQVTADDADTGVALVDIDASVGSEGSGVSAAFGLNDLVTGSGAADIRVRADLLADPSLLATSVLSTETGLTAGDTGLSGGSGEIAAALQSVLAADQDFAAAGGLGARTKSIADYAGDIVAAAGSAAERAADQLTLRETTEANLQDQLSSRSGVNVDEETAALADLQQQYELAAQMLSVLNDLFDTLLNAIE